jgi:hypothetical protein
LPQGGVAMALAFTAAESYPEHGAKLGAVVVAAVFIFELIGPIATRLCLDRNA